MSCDECAKKSALLETVARERDVLRKEKSDLDIEVGRLSEQASVKNDLRKALHDADLQVRDLTSRLCHALCDCGPAYTPEVSAHRKDCRFSLAVAHKRVEEKRSCGAKIEGGRCAFFWPCKEHCGDRNGGSVCVKTPGHGGCCEDEHHVWDWKPKLRGE